MTAAKFNSSGRKLIIGFKSGGFKVYNFGNGQALQEGFHCQGPGLGSLSTLGTFVIHSLANVMLQTIAVYNHSVIPISDQGDIPMICGVGFGVMVGTWLESNQIRDIVCPPSTLYKGCAFLVNNFRCQSNFFIISQDQDVVSCSAIPGNRIASGSISGMIFIHSIESSVLIMKWHIDDVMFGYGEGLRMESRSDAELSPTQVRSLRPQDFTINRSRILADKVSFVINMAYFYQFNPSFFR